MLGRRVLFLSCSCSTNCYASLPPSSTADGKPTNSEKIIDQQSGLEVLRGDQYVYQSPNKLCVTGLAPTHPLIAQRQRYKVLNLRFDKKIMAALPQPTAIPANAKKQPPPPCHAETVICKIEAQDLEYVAPPQSTPSEDTDMTAPTTVTTVENEAFTSSSPSNSEQQQQQAGSGRVDAPKVKESVDPSRVMFVIRGAINSHVMELNERLLSRGNTVITDPTVVSTVLDKVKKKKKEKS